MPVSVRHSPFDRPAPTQAPNLALRTPQARVLAALQPDDPSDPLIDWPLVTRAQLGVRAGYTAISGTVTRALNGIRPGNTTSGDPHPGLLERGMIEEVVLDIEGVREVNYRATALGVRAYQAYIAAHKNKLPDLKPADLCTNDHYRESTPPKPGPR